MLDTTYIHTKDIEMPDGVYQIWDRVYNNVSYTIRGSPYVFDVLDETIQPDLGKNDLVFYLCSANGMDVMYSYRYSGTRIPTIQPTHIDNVLVDTQKVIWPDGSEHYNKEVFYHFSLICVSRPENLAAYYWGYGLAPNADIDTAQFLYKDAIIRARYLNDWEPNDLRL
jgi:hypothetical protein